MTTSIKIIQTHHLTSIDNKNNDLQPTTIKYGVLKYTLLIKIYPKKWINLAGLNSINYEMWNVKCEIIMDSWKLLFKRHNDNF